VYVPPHFEEQRIEVLGQLIREYPLGTLVTLDAQGLNANPIPFEFDPDPEPLGTLRGHVARANPLWRDFSRAVDALVVFLGPQSYITPSWYPTKAQSGEVVPTYNYLAVHAYGSLRIRHEADWLRALVTRLSERFEAKRAEPWRLTDAPATFVEQQLRAIVGLELKLTRVIGKWKVSQNRPAVDRAGVVAGLSQSADPASVTLARWVKDKAPS
jgi:transcriptional regulator